MVCMVPGLPFVLLLFLRIDHPKSSPLSNLKERILQIPSSLAVKVAIFLFVFWDLINTHQDDPLWDFLTLI